ncbi:MAG: CDP-alcohol phosphatidyltransferase family protein [Planctomycetes bacterium]|nr:CDP-alcohol phosphatidyltransferase family protein [Planctomycetota bacterium]
MTKPRLEDYPPLRRGRRGLRRLREVPVAPSLVTLGNLFFGFLAIAKVADALQLAQPGAPFHTVVDLFRSATVLIFVAMVLDALDGRVARMTGQTSSFGAQLDSLCDMVTFGLAPAFLAKVLIDWHAQVGNESLLALRPKLYYSAAAVYVLCAAIRLARFNVETGDDDDHSEFKGLPTPGAAAVVGALVALFCTRNDPDAELGRLVFGDHFEWIVRAMPLVLVTLGLLMVSRVPFPHALQAIVQKRHSIPFLAALVVLIVIAALEWQFALAAVTVGYIAWGLGLGAVRFALRSRDGRDDDDDDGNVEPAYERRN